jgi:hypothetical protein
LLSTKIHRDFEHYFEHYLIAIEVYTPLWGVIQGGGEHTLYIAVISERLK